MLAAQAPDLHDALQQVAEEGWSHVILDGKVFDTDRCAETTTSVKGNTIDAWYSGKHRDFGGNIQAVMRPDGLPDLDLRRRARPPPRPDRRPRPTCSARCTGPPPNWTCPPWPTAATTAPARRAHPGQATRRRRRLGIDNRAYNALLAVPALPRRTRLRPAHRPLARPAAHHRQPTQNRRHRRRRTRTHPIRTPLPTPILLRSPQCWRARSPCRQKGSLDV